MKSKNQQNNKILKRHEELLKNRARLDSASSVSSEDEDLEGLEKRRVNKSKVKYLHLLPDHSYSNISAKLIIS